MEIALRGICYEVCLVYLGSDIVIGYIMLWTLVRGQLLENQERNVSKIFSYNKGIWRLIYDTFISYNECEYTNFLSGTFYMELLQSLTILFDLVFYLMESCSWRHRYFHTFSISIDLIIFLITGMKIPNIQWQTSRFIYYFHYYN